MRQSIVFYRSFYEAIKELPYEIQGEIYNAIFDYSLNGNTNELSGVAKTIFILIKPQLDANQRKYENGSKGGRPKQNETEQETKKEPKNNLKKTKVKPNVNDNVNVNVNVNNENDIIYRKSRFADILKPFVEIYGKEMMNEFFAYWTEHGPNDKKMRYEKEKSFDASLRLQRWNRNNLNSKSNTNGKSNRTDEQRSAVENFKQRLVSSINK